MPVYPTGNPPVSTPDVEPDQEKDRDEKTSLYGVDPEDALKALLATPRPEK